MQTTDNKFFIFTSGDDKFIYELRNSILYKFKSNHFVNDDSWVWENTLLSLSDVIHISTEIELIAAESIEEAEAMFHLFHNN